MTKPLRIGIWGAHLTWDGGIDFLVYLCQGILSNSKGREVEFVLVLPHNKLARYRSKTIQLINNLRERKWKGIKEDPVNERILSAFRAAGIPHQTVHYNYIERSLPGLLKAHETDVFLPVLRAFDFDMDVPWVGYIPDLQHKHLPHFFSEKELEKRDARFFELTRKAKVILVNALEVKSDIEKHYAPAAKIMALPFCPPPPGEDQAAAEVDAPELYRIIKPYFIICNQFWKHKDHITAFRAFIELQKKTGNKYALVCTGKMEDPRFPEYISELKDLIKQNAQEENILLLGFIPKSHQLQLIRKSIALIQPTLFEGGPGGGAVYNALTVGARCLVSNIGINLEINNPSVSFFKAGDRDDLLNKMEEMCRTPFVPADIKNLKEQNRQASAVLGNAILSVIEEAMS